MARDYRAEYARRITSALARGLSRPQARGHALRSELSASRIRAQSSNPKEPARIVRQVEPQPSNREQIVDLIGGDQTRWLAELDKIELEQERGWETWIEAAYYRGIGPRHFAKLYLAAQRNGWKPDYNGPFSKFLIALGLKKPNGLDIGHTDDLGNGDTGYA